MQTPIDTSRRSLSERGSHLFRVVLVLLIVTGLGLLVWGGIRFFESASDVERDSVARKFVESTGRAVVSAIKRTVVPAIDRGRILAASTRLVAALKQHDPARLTAICNDAVRNATEVDAIAIFDKAGAITAINTIYADGAPIAPDRVSRVMKRDYSTRDIIAKCLNNNSKKELLEFQTRCDITPALFDSSGLSVAHSIPVFDREGAQVGVVSTRMRFERLTRLLRDFEIAGGRGSIELVTDSGRFFDEAVNAGRAPPSVSRECLADLVAPLARGDATHIAVDHGGEYHGLFRVGGVSTLEGGGIQVMVSAPRAWMLHEMHMQRLIAAGIPTAIGLLVLAIAALFGALSRSAVRGRVLDATLTELRAFFGMTPDYLCMLDTRGRFIKLNSHWESLLGHPVNEIRSTRITDHVVAPDRDPTEQQLARLAEGHEIDGFVNRFQTPSDDCRSLEWRARMANGVIYATARDVTDTLMHQRELAALEQRLRLFVEHTPAAVAMFDTEMRYVLASEGWYQQYGLKHRNIIGRRHYDIVQTTPGRCQQMYRRALQGESLRVERDMIELPGGQKVWIRWNMQPWYTAEKCIGGVMLFTQVINEQIEYEQNLELARQNAESASIAKSEFLANMSHEIRTPMTAILGFADALLDKDLSESEKAGAIQTIRRNGEHLLQIINDILDISKIEAGKFEIEHIRLSPGQLARDVHSLMSVRAQSRNLQFNLEFRNAIPRHVDSDPTRIRQILVNLIGNAIKFTETGSVRLVVSLLSPEQRGDVHDVIKPEIRFDVIDTGIGISQDQLGRLFRPFSQADSSTTRNFGGTGLGLTISKRMAQLLGGDVTVRSTPGLGSTFTLAIPTGPLEDVGLLDDPKTSEQQDLSAADGAGQVSAPRLACRVLLAEDSPDSSRLIRLVLVKAGAEVSVADNGKAAVETCMHALQTQRPFDIVLMDMQMPEMDGYEASRTLRKLGYPGPIIALTAHAMDGDRKKCLDAGCTDYATKPIDRRALVEKIYRWISKSEAAGVHSNERPVRMMTEERRCEIH